MESFRRLALVGSHASGAGLRRDPKRPARCGFFEHGSKLTPKDIEQKAEDQLEALLDPVLFATGFDADVLREVRSALSLLNRLYDDVPEQLARTLARIDIAEPWRATFVELTRALATVRDAGIGPANHRAPNHYAINSAHYERMLWS